MGKRNPTMTSQLHQFKAEFFKVLAHPLRLAILDAVKDGEKSVSMLKAELGVEQSTLSQQLGVLRRRGFVKVRREATLSFYSARDPEVYAFLDMGRRLFERQLQASSQLLERLKAADASPTEPE